MVDSDKVRAHVDEVVRSTVRQALNQLLGEEPDRVAGAAMYEHSTQRLETWGGGLFRGRVRAV